MALFELAGEDEARGRGFSASDKLERVALYLLVAERMQQQGSAGREKAYSRARAAFDRSTALGKLNRERVEIALPDGTMTALWTRALGEGPRPKDRQIALDYAHLTHDQLVASPRRELRVFTTREGGVEHVGADNMSYGRDYIADWFAETLGGNTG